MGRTTFLYCAAPLLLYVSATAQTPVGELFASDPGAPSVAQSAGTGMMVLQGSEVSAGIAPAALKLARGGQVRICPRSQLNINGGTQGLMMGMGAGSIEVDYHLDTATDLIVTPDFNIRVAGPGAYHFALGVTSQGDTCFKPLPGNTAGVVFSELSGTDMYGVPADEAAFFPGGKLGDRKTLAESCGCPAAPPVVKTAEAPGSTHEPEPEVPAPGRLTSRGVGAPVEPGQPGSNRAKVETPFVFSATAAAAVPAPVAKVDFASLPNVLFEQEEADPVVQAANSSPPAASREEKKAERPPEAKKEKEKKGFLGRVKGFFGSIFRR